jgi:hypothetical protein
MKRVWIAAVVVVGILSGCSPQGSPPTFTGRDHADEPIVSNPSSGGSGQIPALEDDDFCVDGVTLGATVNELRAHNKLLSDRRLGGYDYTFRFNDVHVSEDGRNIDVIQSYVQSLCANQRRLKLDKVTAVTRDQVQAAYGDPSAKVIDGDEYWFYTDPKKDKVMIFRFRRDKDLKAERVQVARLSAARHLWYPLLGEDITPKPLTREDAAIGPIAVGMDSDKIEDAIGENGSEGDKRPYYKLLFRDKLVEVHFDLEVRAVYVTKDTSLATPRGIHIGSSADAVREAYGPPRVAPNRYVGEYEGDYWSYESLRDGVGLVFTIKDNKVTYIVALDADYVYRPIPKE